MDTRKMICISCPLGCDLEVEVDGEMIEIKGSRCKRGQDYARNEILDPRRMVTSNVRAVGGDCPLVSVKTSAPIPKDLIRDLIQALKEIRLESPVRIGQVIIHDFKGTGVDILATREVVSIENEDMSKQGEIETTLCEEKGSS